MYSLLFDFSKREKNRCTVMIIQFDNDEFCFVKNNECFDSFVTEKSDLIFFSTKMNISLMSQNREEGYNRTIRTLY